MQEISTSIKASTYSHQGIHGSFTCKEDHVKQVAHMLYLMQSSRQIDNITKTESKSWSYFMNKLGIKQTKSNPPVHQNHVGLNILLTLSTSVPFLNELRWFPTIFAHKLRINWTNYSKLASSRNRQFARKTRPNQPLNQVNTNFKPIWWTQLLTLLVIPPYNLKLPSVKISDTSLHNFLRRRRFKEQATGKQLEDPITIKRKPISAPSSGIQLH